MKHNEELINIILSLSTKEEVKNFLSGMFTSQEIEQLNQRLKIIKLLKQGVPQREIAESLGVGIATVTRGSKELRQGKFEYV